MLQKLVNYWANQFITEKVANNWHWFSVYITLDIQPPIVPSSCFRAPCLIEWRPGPTTMCRSWLILVNGCFMKVYARQTICQKSWLAILLWIRVHFAFLLSASPGSRFPKGDLFSQSVQGSSREGETERNEEVQMKGLLWYHFLYLTGKGRCRA